MPKVVAAIAWPLSCIGSLFSWHRREKKASAILVRWAAVGRKCRPLTSLAFLPRHFCAPVRETAAEVTAFDLVYQEKFRAEYGECRNCYLSWPEGTEGVPPRPQFEDDGFTDVLAVARGQV
jgi:hypothetical protein